MLEPTYIEWVFVAFAAGLYLYIWINGITTIKANERKKRGGRK